MTILVVTNYLVLPLPASNTVSSAVAESPVNLGSVDVPLSVTFVKDIIPVFEKFMDAGVNHFVIRFWGKNYFGSIDKFATHVIPVLREKAKAKAQQ